MDPYSIAAIIAVITGAYMQHEGQQAKIKENVRIQQRHDQEQDKIRDEKRSEILANTDDYNPGAWADGVKTAQNERIAAIEALQAENGGTDFRFAANESDAALAEGARAKVAQKGNAATIARLMGKMGGYDMFGQEMGRDHLTKNTKFGRFAARDRWNEASRQRDLAGNNKGAKRNQYGGLLQAIGMAYLGSSGGMGGGGGMTNAQANNTASNGLMAGQQIA